MSGNHLKPKTPETARRYEWELLKALAIISMILCNPVIRLGIHWIILGFVDSIFCYLLDITFPWPVIYLIGVVLIVLSSWIAKLWAGRKRRAKAK